MAIKDGPEYARYMAQRLVRYIDTPREARKQARIDAKSVREHWIARWFGWAGTGVVMWWAGRRPAGQDAAAADGDRLAESGVHAAESQRIVQGEPT